MAAEAPPPPVILVYRLCHLRHLYDIGRLAAHHPQHFRSAAYLILVQGQGDFEAGGHCMFVHSGCRGEKVRQRTRGHGWNRTAFCPETRRPEVWMTSFSWAGTGATRSRHVVYFQMPGFPGWLLGWHENGPWHALRRCPEFENDRFMRWVLELPITEDFESQAGLDMLSAL